MVAFYSYRQLKDCWFRLGSHILHPSSTIFWRSGYALVPRSWDSLGFDGLLHSNWHLGDRLYLCRNGDKKTFIRWRLRTGPTLPHFPYFGHTQRRCLAWRD
jgi:hypothetical protein